MPLPTRVALAPSTRPPGGLLSAARQISGEWWRGITFTTGQCLGPQRVGACPDPEVTKDTSRSSPVSTFDAFGVLQAVQCSTFSRSDLSALAASSLDATREWAVARELLTGAASSNPSLATATDLGAASNAVEALGCLDQTAANEIFGRLAFIHASPAIANAWLAAGAIYREGVRWLTASGNVVVVSPGYDGRSPGGTAPSAGDTLYAYVTGEVYAAVGQRQELSSIERSQDTAETWAEDAAVVAFDPCFSVAVDTSVPLCSLTS